MRKIAGLSLSALVVVISGWVTLAHADWRGTDWITDGSVISSENIKQNFDYLYNRVNGLTGTSTANAVQVGNTDVACTPDIDGTLRWTGTKLEICTNGVWTTFYANNYCRVEQISRSCDIPYSCSCGKYGCSTCYTEGIQYQASITCPDTSAQMGWSSCEAI